MPCINSYLKLKEIYHGRFFSAKLFEIPGKICYDGSKIEFDVENNYPLWKNAFNAFNLCQQ